MKIAVDDQGYASATSALVGGNLLAADVVLGLDARLRGYAGMAGDDATAADFAATYDEAAAVSLAALASLVGALGALGHLVEASLANHAVAEARSTLAGTVTGPPTVADEAVGVRVSAPPSSLGADTDGPGGLSGVVLDLLQDVFWPNADTDRVRAAASTWWSAAEAVGLLTGQLDSAAADLETERSPEVPVAIGVLTDLRGRVDELAAQLAELGSACQEFADHVDAKRSELLSLLESLAVELGATAVVGGALSFLSGGAAAGAAGGVGAARLAAAGSKARGILDSLRILAAGSALRARPVAVTVGDVGAYTARISRARVMLMEGGSAGPARFGRSPGGLIGRSEGPGRGHTIERHVGKTTDYLLARVRRHPTAKHASTYLDEASAERALEALLRRKRSEIEAWLRSAKKEERFDDILKDPTGVSVNRAGEVLEVRGIRAILVRDRSMPEGYWVKTSFPQP